MRLAAMQIWEDIFDEDWIIDLCISMAKHARPLKRQAAMIPRQQFRTDQFEVIMCKALAAINTGAPDWQLTLCVAYIKAATSSVPMTGVSHTATTGYVERMCECALR